MVRGYFKRRGQAAGTGAWTTTMNQGLGNLIENVRDRLKGLEVSAEEP